MNPKKEIIERLSTEPQPGTAVVCLDETGPESAKSHKGRLVVHAEPQPGADGHPPRAWRAQQEIDYGRRGGGSIFGAFRPTTGETFCRPYGSQPAANRADFLAQVEG